MESVGLSLFWGFRFLSILILMLYFSPLCCICLLSCFLVAKLLFVLYFVLHAFCLYTCVVIVIVVIIIDVVVFATIGGVGG